jgi:hypothetical protein
MKKLIAVMLFALTYNGAMAQEKFLPGYVKTAEGVRTDGLIDYRNWDNNPKKVTFKRGEQGKAQVFEALDIAEFGVKDEIYVGAIVEKEITTNVSSGLSKSPEVEVRIDTVFLQTLVSGEKTLLGMKAAGKQNFYIKEGGNYVLLQYKWYMTEKNGAQMRAENTMFRRQLATYLGECLRIIDPLQSATYTSKSLESIFLRYYACTDKMPAFMKVREKVITELGVLGGASSTHLTFESAMAVQDIVNYKFPSATGVVGGLFLDIVFPRNNRKWSFYNELFYSSYSVSGSFQEIRDENDYRNVEGNLGYTYLKVNNMVRYRYPIAGFKIFVNAGMSNAFALSETNKKSTFTKFYSTETNQEGKVLAETRKYEQGLLLGVGAMAGRITGEFRYERANGMSVYPLLSSRVERYFLLVSYRLK